MRDVKTDCQILPGIILKIPFIYPTHIYIYEIETLVISDIIICSYFLDIMSIELLFIS